MDRDWLHWHAEYDDPSSSLARRLTVVRGLLGRALAGAPSDAGVQRVASMCAGDGRDLLPVLTGPDRGHTVRALLVELDPALAGRARAAAAAITRHDITVLTADAGEVTPYLPLAPLHLVLACGVFGNITTADAHRTIAALPGLLADGGLVLWTRGRGTGAADPSDDLRTRFADHGFAELAFTAPADARFRVGLHRLTHRPGGAVPEPGTRLFTFV
jgi:hypothetical protein